MLIKPRRKKDESIDEYNKRVIKLYYGDGYHIKEISNKLKIDEIEVYNCVTNGKKITTEAEREEMIHLYNQGYSYNAIGRIFNKTHSCVKERIEKPAKIICKSNNKLTDRQLRKMTNMAKDGLSTEAIAKELGVKVSTVRYRLSHTGIREKTTHVSKSEVNKFIRLHNEGKTIKEIAKICNRGKNTVSRHLRAAGF